MLKINVVILLNLKIYLNQQTSNLIYFFRLTTFLICEKIFWTIREHCDTINTNAMFQKLNENKNVLKKNVFFWYNSMI